MNASILKVLACACAVATAGTAHANPVDSFGLGARSVGMGGAAGALLSEASANYYNPAALATVDDLRIELGYVYVDPNLTLNGQDLEVDGVRGLQTGILLPGKILGHRLAVSLSLYLPDERITRLRALPERQPRFVLYDNRPQRIVLTTSAAFEVWPDWVYLGAGLTYLSDTKGRLNVAGTVDLQEAGSTTLLSAVDVNFQAVRYPSASLMVTPGEHLKLALTYRAPFDLTLDIGLDVQGDIVVNGASDSPSVVAEDARLTVVSTNANLFSPRQLALSAGWQAKRWAIGLELAWHQWSEFRSPTAFIVIDLDAGTLPLSVPQNPAPQAPGFHDIVIPRLGGEWVFFQSPHVALTARLGTFYEPSPAPDQPGRTNYVDSDKIGLGFGLGLTLSDLTEIFPRPIQIDLAGLFVFMTERVYRKDDPADPVGEYVAEGMFGGLSATVGFAF